MKQVIRISILMCGLVGTYVAAAVPQVPAPDGGPILVCPPQQQLQNRCAGSAGCSQIMVIRREASSGRQMNHGAFCLTRFLRANR